MCYSDMNLNPDNTEFILDSKMEKGRLKEYYPVDILGAPLQLADSIENLGFWLDSDIPFSKQI